MMNYEDRGSKLMDAVRPEVRALTITLTINGGTAPVTVAQGESVHFSVTGDFPFPQEITILFGDGNGVRWIPNDTGGYRITTIGNPDFTEGVFFDVLYRYHAPQGIYYPSLEEVLADGTRLTASGQVTVTGGGAGVAIAVVGGLALLAGMLIIASKAKEGRP